MTSIEVNDRQRPQSENGGFIFMAKRQIKRNRNQAE